MGLVLDVIRMHLDGDTLHQINRQIGGDRSGTRRAVVAALPLLIGGLASRARRARGAAEALAQALERDHDGSLLDNLHTLLAQSGGGHSLSDADSEVPGGVTVDRRTVDGDGILRHVFGDRRQAVELGISRASDLDVRMVAQLLPLLAPVVLSALGRIRLDHGLDPDGLTALLDEELDEWDRHLDDNRGLSGLFELEEERAFLDRVAEISGALIDALEGEVFS